MLNTPLPNAMGYKRLLLVGLLSLTAACNGEGAKSASSHLEECQNHKDCGDDELCIKLTKESPNKICSPLCESDDECPAAGWTCGHNGACDDVESECQLRCLCEITPDDCDDGIDNDCDGLVDDPTECPRPAECDATVMLLADRSGSMSSDMGGQSRWEVLGEALFDDTNGVVSTLEQDVRFGWASYTGYVGQQCLILDVEPPAYNNADAMEARYDSQGPDDDTPTHQAIRAMADDDSLWAAPGRDVLVVAVDGNAEGCDPLPGNPGDGPNTPDEAVEAVQYAYSKGIEVYVINVANGAPNDLVQRMARAGVGLDPDGDVDAQPFPATDLDSLTNGLTEILETTCHCGNGFVEPELGEECDPGIDANCSEDCKIESYCGDGEVDPLMGETCEPSLNPECDDDCTYCGDGTIDEDEECDNGEGNGQDGECRADCTAPMCGDGIVDWPEETCDPADPDAPDNCRTCDLDDGGTYCGDGIVNGDEECDLEVETNTCTATCECKCYGCCGS